MAFDFGGTANATQIQRLVDFCRGQLALVQDRITHLTAEQIRIGGLTMVFSNGIPTGYSTGDPTSYLGKLLIAYETLGGDPFYDLQVRLASDPVYLVKGDETTDPQIYSSGEVKGASKGLADGISSELVQKMRAWAEDTMSYRKERLERKIRRAMDYVDSLQVEIDLLTNITQSVDTDSSLENLVSQIFGLVTDPTYRAIQDDKGQDPFALMTYAPFAGYEPSDNRGGAQGYGRTEAGAVVPGEVPPDPTQPTGGFVDTEEGTAPPDPGTTST